MNCRETTLDIPCGDETLLGIVAHSATPRDTGILIVVGGPQYRVGSHRQFVLLARSLAAAGYASLRFDYRGMGDSPGELRNFEQVTEDIAAATSSLVSAVPDIRRVVIWGLCDAASAALLYWDDSRDRRIAGLCLLNPWVRSEATLARTQVKHYYGQRLMQPAFWAKLLRGEVGIGRALTEFAGKLLQANAGKATGTQKRGSYQSRMASAARDFPGPLLLLISDNDYVAKEFTDHAAGSGEWAKAFAGTQFTRVDIADADHTFSSAIARGKVEAACREWLDAAFPVQ